MLRVIQQSNSAAAKSYYSHSDYYAKDQPSPGVWGGKGAEMLGLHGSVRKDDFERLCDNVDPRTGEPLTARTSSKRTVLYDFNFHVPKGFSLLGEVTQDPRLRSALDDSIRETMKEVEADMKTRVRKGKANEERTTGNMVWAGFFHRETRPSKEDGLPDPHWHTHVCVMNATYDEKEEQWKAGQFRELKADAPYYEAVFHSRLAKRAVDLGYDIRRKGRGGRDWEIANLPDNLLRKFSRRTKEIEDLAEKKGITDPKEKDALGAKSRKAKNKQLSPKELRDAWLGRMTPDELLCIVETAKAAEAQQDRVATRGDDLAAAFGIKQSFERESVVTERTVKTNALRFGIGRSTPEGIAKELRSQGLIVRTIEGKRLATTKEVLREEKAMLAFARHGRGSCKPLAPGDHQFKNPLLDDGQCQGVNRLLASTDRVTMLVGKAGVGKTTLLMEAVDAIEANGKHVHVFAPSSEASYGVLRREGFLDAHTVARLLVDQKIQAQIKGQVLLVDEAGLLGTKTMNELFELAGRQQARVILVGDPKQHRSVERGSPMRMLESEAGIKPTVVNDIKRQKGEYKLAVADFSEGRTIEGLKRLDGLGWIKELPDDVRNQELARDYVKAFAAGESVLAISPTRAEGAAINSAIRAELRKANQLEESGETVSRLVDRQLTEAERSDPTQFEPGDVVEFHQNAPGFKRGQRVEVVAANSDGVSVTWPNAETKPLPLSRSKHFTLFRKEDLELAAGDLIRFTKNGKSLNGNRINNGTTTRIAGFESNGDLRLDNGWRIGREFGHVSHGYCLTSHAAQGRTVQHQVFIAQSSASYPASSPEQAYVSASRARQRVTIYTDSIPELFDAINRQKAMPSAIDLLRRHRQEQWARRREKIRRIGVTLRRFAALERSDHHRQTEREMAHER